MLEQSPVEKRKPSIVFTSSGAPFGVTELWFQAEVRELVKSFDVIIAPTWPRGDRSPWAGRTLTSSGYPPVAPLKTLRALVSSRELRSILWGTRDTANLRTRGKSVLSFFVALQWAFLLESLDLEVCHVHATTVAAPATGAAVLAIRLGIPSSATAHRGDIVKRSPERSIARLDLVRAISEKAKEMLASEGIASSVLRFGALDEVKSASVATPSATLRGVAIGHLSVIKGHTRALKMARKAIDDGVDLHLDIYGNGPLEDDLRREIAELDLTEHVALCGFLPHDDLLAEMGSGRWNLLIHPSIEEGSTHEGIPVCILEAAANGIPVVASRSGSIPEFIVNEHNGLLFDAKNAERAVVEGARALIEIAGDLDLQVRLATNGLASAQDYVSAQTIAAMQTALSCSMPLAQ